MTRMKWDWKKAAVLSAAAVLTFCICFSAFGATFVPSDQTEVEGGFLLVCKTDNYGNYLVGIDGETPIVSPVADLAAIENDDARFVFTMEYSDAYKKWALKCNGRYLAFPYSEEFIYQHAIASGTPEYHWETVKSKSSGKTYLKYAAKGKAGGLWVNDGWVSLVTLGPKANDIVFYVQGESDHKITGGWKQNGAAWRYLSGVNSYVENDWVQENGAWYYMDGNGNMVTGLADVSGSKYYFNSDGVMMTNTEMSVGAVPYTVGGDGLAAEASAASPERSVQAEDPLASKALSAANVINWINARRWREGLPPMKRDNRLSLAAQQIHGMAAGRQVVDGGSLFDLLHGQGVFPEHAVNLSVNLKESGRLSLDWYMENGDIPGFRSLTVDPNYNHIGVFGSYNEIGRNYDYILVYGQYE